jgi:hypothetical protein
MRFGFLVAHGEPPSVMTQLFLSATLLLLLPKDCVSQANSSPPARDTPQVVVVSEKSPFLAGALEVITLPTIGYAYAGNWTRGLPSAAVRILGLALWGEQLDPIGPPPPCEARCAVGAIMLLGGWIWAASDAAGTARRTNEERRAEALGAIVLPTLEGRRVGVLIQLRIPR